MIICIVGPTGVGKTKLSIEIAKKYNAIIINCDAMQVYKDLNVGTAKITEEEKESIKHYLLNIKDVNDPYSVYDYQKDARAILDKYKRKNIIFVGGTGLYLKAALYDYRFKEENNNNTYDNYNDLDLYKMVLQKDPKSTIHPNNRKRMIRYLNKEDIEIVPPIPLYDHIIIGLTTNRDNLYKIINNRVDTMFKNGLLEEVKQFYDKNIRSKAINTGIGYKELYKYFDKEITLDEAKELIKKNSRHYAKRQYTFFNHQLPVEWFNVDYDNFNNTIKEVEKRIEEYKNDRSKKRIKKVQKENK